MGSNKPICQKWERLDRPDPFYRGKRDVRFLIIQGRQRSTETNSIVKKAELLLQHCGISLHLHVCIRVSGETLQYLEQPKVLSLLEVLDPSTVCSSSDCFSKMNLTVVVKTV